MARQNTPNYAGLRSALVLGSVAASVLGGRLLTNKDAAAQAQADALAAQEDAAAQAQATDATPMPTAMLPQPTPTPKVIIIYDLPPVAGAPKPASGTVIQSAPQLPQPPVINSGGGGGGGGGGGNPNPPPVKKSKPSKK